MEQKITDPRARLLLKLIPLVLDLDGTLIHTDTFHEMMVHLLHKKPWLLLKVPFWLFKGRPFAKARLVEETNLSPTHLPYNAPLLKFAQDEAKAGRPLILATGTHHKVAQRIADELGGFQDVIGTDAQINMIGLHKQKALLTRFGVQGFDYAGDSHHDVHIWCVARKAIVVHPKRGVLKRAKALQRGDGLTYFPRKINRFKAFILALRPLFWLCNLIVPSWHLFVALGLLTSGLFICDDLFTLYQERAGSFKKSVFAEGHLHLSTAFIVGPLLIIPPLFLFPSLLLIYSPLFIAADILTRSKSQVFRWALLSLFQVLGLWLFFM